MGRGLVVAALAVIGLLCAAGMGVAAYVVSRGSVAVPVTRLQRTPPLNLTPSQVRKRPRPNVQPTSTTTTTATATVIVPPPPPPPTTTDDHGRGRSGGGHGGDD